FSTFGARFCCACWRSVGFIFGGRGRSLAQISRQAEGGFYLICTIPSAFMPLPSSFCSLLPQLLCSGGTFSFPWQTCLLIPAPFNLNRICGAMLCILDSRRLDLIAHATSPANTFRPHA